MTFPVSDRLCTLSSRLLQQTNFIAAGMSGRSICYELLSLLLTYALLLQLIPRVAAVAPLRPQNKQASEKRESSTNRFASNLVGADAAGAWNTLLSPGSGDGDGGNGGDVLRATITDAVVTRQKPTFNSGRIEGTLRVLLGQSFTINNNTQLTSDLYLPGTPAIQLSGGALYGGTVTEAGAAAPSNYTVSLTGGVNLPGRIHNHVDPIALPSDFPGSIPPPTATRNVTVHSQSDVAGIGNWQTVRDLNVTGAHISLDVPPGNYGTLTVNGNSQLNFTAGTYNFSNTFNLDGSATLRATGLVTINVAQNLTLNSGAVVLGSYTSPADLHLNVLGPLLNINGSSQVSGLIRADNGTVTLNGTSQVRGQVIANSLTLSGGKVIGAVWPAQSGSRLTVLGPRRFDRTTGPPNQYVEQFALPAGVTSPYTLHVQNGEPDGSNRISSATVKLNGVDALTPNDLNQNVASVDRTVTLAANNQLDVRVDSIPGSYLIIDIAGVVPASDTTPPTIAVTSPANNSTTTAAQTIISGTAADVGSGASGVAHVYVNNSEAAYNSAGGTWTISDVALALGANQLNARAVDQAGNEAAAGVTVTRESPANQAPTSDSGPDQTLALPQAASLDGMATDDGLPEGSSFTTTWTKVSGPGSVTFADAGALETTATFSIPGTYVLSLTASDGTLSTSDYLTITVQPQNHPPTVSGGPDQTIALPQTAVLNGTVTDDGVPAGSTVTILWSEVSGPGPVTFEDPSLPETTAAFSAPGTYVLRLTASDTELTSNSDITITVQPENQAPTVNAGPDQIISLPGAAQLDGAAADDGWPARSSLSLSWNFISGPGSVSFDNPNAAITIARFEIAGTYVLRLTAGDGELSSSDDVNITVTPPNQAPSVNAGPDQTISLPTGIANLNGSISDDGLPLGSGVSTNWSKVSGPGAVIFANPNVTVTIASFSETGAYVLRLTANDSQLAASDDITIVVIDPRVPPVANFVVPQSTGTAGAFVIASSGFTSSAFAADKVLDDSTSTFWQTPGVTNQFAKMQLFDQQMVFIDRVRLQPANGVAGSASLKDFEVQVSATTADDASFVTVLSATLLNNGQLQEFVLPGGPVPARYIKLLLRTNYGSASSFTLGTFNAVAVGSVDNIISLPGQVNAAMAQSPGLLANGAAIYDSSYPGGNASPNGLLGYNNGGWFTTSPTNQFAIIQLAGGKLYTIDGIKLATASDLGFGSATAVKDFEVWVSATTPDNASFTKVLTATAAFSGQLQTFIFPGGPVPARYVKYAPLTNGGSASIRTQSFDVIAEGVARVVSASGQNQNVLNPPEAAFDGDIQSIWFSPSNATTNVWVKTALAGGAMHKVYGVRISPVNNFTVGQRGPKDFDIRVSATTTDDSAFTTIYSGTLAGTFNGGTQEFLFPNFVDARYVEFFWKNGYSTANIGVSALEVLAAPTRGAALVAFSTQEDPASNALDLQPSDQWVTALNNPTNQWLKLLLPNADLSTINHIALRPAIATNGDYSAPKDFELQVSTTDSADSSFTTVLAGTLANSTQLQDCYFAPAQARYVRLLLKNNYGAGRFGLASFYVYSADQIGSTTRFIDRSTDADGSVEAWNWNFGDGGTSGERHPAHTFAAPGNYTVSLTVTDNSGLTNTRQVPYRVLDSLRADFSYSPMISHEGGEAVRFTDTTQLLTQATTARKYAFGDGATLSQATTSSSHTFNDSGVFHVTLKVGDPLGIDLEASKDIVVLNMTPAVDIDPGKTIVWGEQWTSVPRISDQSSVDSASLRGQWDFGDGQTSQCLNCTNANATVSHAYSNPDTYTAALTITDKDGGVGADNAVFTVNKRPIGLALQNTPTLDPGKPVQLRVRLIDNFTNQPLVGRTVEFALNGAAASAITDANGYGEVTVTFAAGLGSNIATATVAEDDLYLGGSTYRVLQGAANQQVCTRSSTGTDFWLMFPGNFISQGVSLQEGTFLEISSEVDTTGTVTIPGQNFTQNFTVAAHTTTQVQVNHYHHNSDQIEARGIHVVSQRPVTVYGLNNIRSTIDAFLGLPTAALGNTYIILAYNNGGTVKGTQFGIAATANATSVTITPAVTVGSRVAGVPYNITLNQGQTYMLRDESGVATDLSGTTILADKPIAVFGGHQCANIPAPTSFCDYLVEQLPPTDTWGTHFAAVPLATRTNGDTFRFLAATNDTQVFVNSSRVATLNRGQFFEKILAGPVEIASNQPILVAQYANSHQYDNQVGDPFMMLIPPLEHYLNAYTVTSLSNFDTNLINVVAPTSDIGAVIFDGAPIFSSSFAPIGNTGASGAQLTVSAGTHTLSGPHPFGVYVYGFGLDVSYGYPGSACLSSVLGATTITLAPKSQNATIGTQGCLTVTVRDQNNTPVNNQNVSFTIAGAHSQTPPNQVTNELGQAQLCYSSATPGDDLITATSGSSSDSAGISWQLPNQAPLVNAGSDQIITLPAVTSLQGSATDDGLPANTLNVSWAKVSGPGDVTFGDPNAAATAATFNTPGVYVLRLTASDTNLSVSDDVQITVNPAPVNQPPAANAGPDQTIAINANLIINGGNEQQLVSGEIPNWTEVQGTDWTQGANNSGSGFPEPQRGGAYFFATDAPQAELHQDVDVSAFAANIAAGTQQFEFKAYVRSAAEAVPDSARVIVEYRDRSNTNLLATLDSGELTSTNAWHLTEDTRTVPFGTGWIRVRLLATRNNGGDNNEGNGAFFDSISLRPVGTAAVKLNGTVTDDGLPFGSSISANWTAISGPGPLTFINANAAGSAVSFTTPGTYVLRLTASDGQLSTSDDVTVIVNPTNQAPIVDAGASQTITLPATASLNGIVTDDGQPQGSSVSVAWSTVSGPGVVAFANSNQATTTASFSSAGTYVLRLTADDSEYESGAEVAITVNPQPTPANQPPAVNPGTNQTISLPTDTLTLYGTATDDGLPTGGELIVTWTQIGGPGVVTFGNANSAVTTAQFSAAGSYVLRLSASDGAYVVSGDVGVILTPQNLAPTADAGADQTILLSQGAQLDGSAGDDGLPAGSSLTTTWIAVGGPGTVTFDNPNVTITGAHFSATGTYVLRLTASDGALSASDDVAITVNENVAPPTVEITSPSDGSELTGPALVTGSVSNGPWVLEYSLNNDDGSNNQVWTQVASGNGPLTNAQLGSLDTTLMLNGIYSLRLKATDQYGQNSNTSVGVVVDKGFKVGQFQLAFSDLNVPVAGLPMEVIRSYDSRDKRVGDFGVGWQLGIKSARVEKTGVLGLSWLETVSSGAIPTYCLEPSRPHKVAITFADGKVFKFQASASIHCQQFVPVTSTQLTFTPEPGTHASLEIVGPNDVLVETQGSLPGPVRLINQGNPDIFNSSTFRLTSAEGVAFVIDQHNGVSSVRDPYGNTLTINAGGIVHSSGQSISFMRDGAGRITQITDPNGNAQTYTYDANSDLVSFTDRENQTTAFTYNSDHRLLTITDARGVNLLRNQYDAGGRMIGQTDAFSNSLTYDHNLPGRVETITDRLGHQTRYEYDERGNVLRQVDAKGGVKTFTYDALDNVLTETDQLDKTTTYTYDAADNRTSITDPLGNVTQFTYNGARRPLTVTDARNNVITNTYDPAGTNLLTTTDPVGKTTTYTYSLFTGQRITLTDALNHQTRYGYDGAGRLNSETDALGHVTTYGYDGNGNRTTQTVTRTNAQAQTETVTTTFTYDKLNRLIGTTFADGSFVRVEYNAIGQQSATIDQLGRRTEFSYDDMGRLTHTDYPDGTHDETTYDAEGRRLTSKDRAGHLTSFTYDELGRLTKTTYPDNTFSSSTYDAAGQVLTTTDPRGNVTHYEYDDAGRRVRVKNALDQETTFAYDATGNQLSMTDAASHTTGYEYDANNRRTKTTYADSSFDTVAYDALGRIVSKTDQAGKTTKFIFDALGRLTKVKDALNQETTYAYDELGQELSQTDANNHTTRFEYDQLGRRVKRILPEGQFETSSYDTGGNLASRTDFNGKITTFTYDVMRRLLTKTPDVSLNQPSISFTYNTIGQRATMSDASGTTAYTYDGRNRLASKQTPFGTLSYTYDEAGNLLTTRSSNTNGVSVDYSYDPLNRMGAVKDNNIVALNGGVTNYSYDTVGNLQSYSYPNGVTSSYAYNSLNRLTTMTVGITAASLAVYSYTLSAAGNRTAVTESSGRTVNYTYDDLYRLTDETIANDPHGINGSVSYGYDPVGNRLNRSSSLAPVPSQDSTYDANDRLTSDSYDRNGNTTLANGADYTYDFENRLILSTQHSVLSTFLYDGDGNRVAKTVSGVTTNYLVDTNNPTGYAQVVDELQGGVVVKSFTYGHDLISQRCTLPTANCSLSFYQYDGHGSVRLLTDSSGAITDTYDYDAFGNLIYRSGTTLNDYLYTGEQFDANLGFYYLRARYLNPQSGRFLSTDSFAGNEYDPASLHKYLYADADPVNRVDPRGQFSLLNTVVTSTIIGAVSGFGLGFLTGGFQGAVRGAFQGAILGALIPLTGAGVGYALLGNAARGVFIVGWGAGLGSAGVSGYSFATATTGEERFEAGVGLVASVAFMFVGPKILQYANTRAIPAEELNAEFLSLRNGRGQPPWAADTNVTETTVFRSVKYVRVYTEGQTKPVGAWVMDAAEIEGLTMTQIQQRFALPFTPTRITTVDVPAGSTIRIGTAGQNDFGTGGGMQVNIKE